MAKNNTTPVEETKTPVATPEEEVSSVEGAVTDKETVSSEEKENGKETVSSEEKENGEETVSSKEKENDEEASMLVDATPNKITFSPEGLDWSLGIMGKGMLGIFIVTTIIVGVTVVLNKVTAPRKKKEKKDK